MSRIKIKYLIVWRGSTSAQLEIDLQKRTDEWLDENKNFNIIDVKISSLNDCLISVITYYESTKRDLILEKEIKKQ